MRCPHCASPIASPPVCITCGEPFDTPAPQPTVPGLEPTCGAVANEVIVAVLPDLETTREEGPGHGQGGGIALGLAPVGLEVTRMPIATRDTAPVAAVDKCPQCGTAVGAARFCESCGVAVPRALAVETSPGIGGRRCRECGILNEGVRPLCAACGRRI